MQERCLALRSLRRAKILDFDVRAYFAQFLQKLIYLGSYCDLSADQLDNLGYIRGIYVAICNCDMFHFLNMTLTFRNQPILLINIIDKIL